MMGRAPADRPLRGRTILLTRPDNAGRDWLERLESLGATVEWRPAIRVVATDEHEPVTQALESLADFEWLIFSSPNGVRFFQDALDRSGLRFGEFEGSIAAVGPGTAAALADAGQRVVLVAFDEALLQ
jgi:uroporphyrinogen-III synthase